MLIRVIRLEVKWFETRSVSRHHENPQFPYDPEALALRIRGRLHREYRGHLKTCAIVSEIKQQSNGKHQQRVAD